MQNKQGRRVNNVCGEDKVIPCVPVMIGSDQGKDSLANDPWE